MQANDVIDILMGKNKILPMRILLNNREEEFEKVSITVSELLILKKFSFRSALLITIMDIYGVPDSIQAAWHVITGS